MKLIRHTLKAKTKQKLHSNRHLVGPISSAKSCAQKDGKWNLNK